MIFRSASFCSFRLPLVAPLAIAVIAALSLGGCNLQRETSFEPELRLVDDSGLAFYDLNCREDDLEGCNRVAIDYCLSQSRRMQVKSHFISGSKVKSLVFVCSTRPQQLVPETIQFNERA